MLSATPLDLGLDPGGYSAEEFSSAATEYAQFVSGFESPEGHSLVESFEYSVSSEVSYSNHVAMARYDFSFVFYAMFNNAPSADAGGPYTITEGESLELDASASTDLDGDPLSFSWDVNGDGVFGDAVEASPTLDWSQLQSLGIEDDGQWTVSVQVDDGYGGIVQAETTLDVQNAAPAVSISGPTGELIEGNEISLGAQAADPGTADTHTFAWDVTKDGEAYASGEGEQLSFTPDDNGIYEVTVTATDDDGGTAEATSSIEVSNAAPTVSITEPTGDLVEGTEISLGAHLADPGTADTHAYAWDVTKDGEAYPSGEGEQFSFTPDDNGIYEVTVTATDDDGGTGAATSSIEVSNVAPTVSITEPTGDLVEGTEISLGAQLTDPGTADTHTYAWDVTKDGEAYASGEGEQFSFTPDDNGTYEVTVTATDDDAESGAATSSMEVSNVAPTVSITEPTGDLVEGTEMNLGAQVADAGTADTHTYAWDVTKDGEAYASGDGEQFSFTPDDNGIYEVTVTATDDDGATEAATSSMDVSNAAPTVSITEPTGDLPEGTEISLDAQVSDPGTVDTHTYAWDVTKDGEAYASGEGEQFSFTPDDNGIYEVTVTATDDDGGTGAATSSVDVSNVAPTLESVAVPDLVSENEPVTVNGEMVDPGTADSFSVEIDWGDGTVETYEHAAGTSTFEGSHSYENGGVYTVSLTLADDDQGTDQSTQTVMVTGAGLNDGVLQLVGSEGDDYGFVGQFADGRYVVIGDFLSTPWQPRVFDGADVQSVEMILGAGNDIGVMAGNVDVPSVLRGGSGSDHLVAGTGDDIVLGGEGDDLLASGGGEDLLVGGLGQDLIVGGWGDDLMIGGSTAFDANDEALSALMAEWTSEGGFDARLANLGGVSEANGLNGPHLLAGGASDESSDATVLDDGARDVLLGGPGSDWFLAGSGGAADEEATDRVIDAMFSDQVDELGDV
jgi:PKD repeat protein